MSEWKCFTNQKQWESYLKNLVKTNDNALFRSIILIYDSQTQEEKNKGESIEDNCIGFSKIDAYEMGQIAKKIKSGQPLTKGEIAKSRNKMQKYWKQLMVISKKRAELEEMQEIEKELREFEERIKKSFEEHFKENETLQMCEEGKSCEYGICSECPLSVLNNGGK